MRDILAARGEEEPPTAAIQPLSCALLNSAMPCTGMIGSVSHSVSDGISLHACVCGVSPVCVCARATCALRARGFFLRCLLCVCYIYISIIISRGGVFFLYARARPRVRVSGGVLRLSRLSCSTLRLPSPGVLCTRTKVVGS